MGTLTKIKIPRGKIPKNGYSREQLLNKGLGNFGVFLLLIWRHLNLPNPTPVQYDIADYLQDGPRRRVIEAFRGVGKSWITAAYVLWILLLNPQAKILIVSASSGRADSFSIFLKQLIHEVPLLRHLAPRRNKNGVKQRDSNITFDVGPATPDQSPSVKSIGITGMLTGSRADVIICDDVESPGNSYTHTMRERIAELVKEFDAIIKPGGEIIYLGTPQTEQSIYNRLPGRGYSITIWPARIPDIHYQHGVLGNLIQLKIANGDTVGTPTDPDRFDEQDLIERQLSYGNSGWNLQFMLNTAPVDAERHPLKVNDLIITDVDKDVAYDKIVWGSDKSLVITDLQSVGFDGDLFRKPAWCSDEMKAFTGSVLAIDPSGGGEDETSYAVVKMLHGMLFLVEAGGFTDGFSETTLEELAKVAERHKVNTTIVEKNYGGGMFVSLLTPYINKIHPNPIEEVWSTGQKELRILDVLEPVMNQHRLIIDRKVIENDIQMINRGDENLKYSLIQQMTRITRERGCLGHDDRIEVLASAVRYWVEQMAQDVDQKHEQHKQDILNKELERHIKHCIGQSAYENQIIRNKRRPIGRVA